MTARIARRGDEPVQHHGINCEFPTRLLVEDAEKRLQEFTKLIVPVLNEFIPN